MTEPLKHDTVWQSARVAQNFLKNVRGGIPLAAEQIDVMLRVIRATTPEVKRFLDLGCGDGIMGRAVLTEYPNATGVFVDFSQPMIDAAKQALGDKFTFLVEDYGDAAWLQTIEPHAPFDVIVSGFSIHHQPDERKRSLYRELYDLLRPGGVFLNLEHVSSASPLIESLFDDLIIDTIHAYGDKNGVHKSREQVAHDHHSREDKKANILASVEDQCTWLRDIGFIHVDCFIKIFELALFGGARPT